MNIIICFLLIYITIFKIIYTPSFQEIIEARLKQRHKKPKSRRDKSKNIHSKSFKDKRDEEIKLIINKMNEEIHNLSKLQALKLYRLMAYERILNDDIAIKLQKIRDKQNYELKKDIDDIKNNIKELQEEFFQGSVVERNFLYKKFAKYELNFRKNNDEKCEPIDKIILEIRPIIKDELEKRIEFMSIYIYNEMNSDLINQTNETIIQNKDICNQNCSRSSENEKRNDINIDLRRINFLVNKLAEYSIKKVMDEIDIHNDSFEEVIKEINDAIVKTSILDIPHYSMEISESLCQKMITNNAKELCNIYIPYVKKLTGLQIKYILYQNPTEFERQISISKNKKL